MPMDDGALIDSSDDPTSEIVVTDEDHQLVAQALESYGTTHAIHAHVRGALARAITTARAEGRRQHSETAIPLTPHIPKSGAPLVCRACDGPTLAPQEARVLTPAEHASIGAGGGDEDDAPNLGTLPGAIQAFADALETVDVRGMLKAGGRLLEHLRAQRTDNSTPDARDEAHREGWRHGLRDALSECEVMLSEDQMHAEQLHYTRTRIAQVLSGERVGQGDPEDPRPAKAISRLPERMHGRLERMAADLRYQAQMSIAGGDEDRAAEISLEASLVERCANELVAMLREEQGSETAKPHHLWSNPYPPSNDPKFAEAKAQIESMTPLWVLIAYVWDRREQYKPSSASHEALCQIIGGLARLDHIEAWKHGELDDLRKYAEDVIEKAPKVMLEKGTR